MNILLTSAGRRSYLVDYFKEAWKGYGEVHASNSSIQSTALFHADKFVVSPEIYDEHYGDFLLEYCRGNQIRVIVPLFDVDLPVLAGFKESFAADGIEIIVASLEALRICNDKWYTFETLRDHQIRVPQTFLSVTSTKVALRGGKVSFPLMVKPRWGMGSIGLYVADNEEELEVFFRKLEREIDRTYLVHESRATPDKKVIIQEFIVGTEYGLDAINNLNGDFITTFVKRKLAMRSGETDAAVTVENLRLFNLGKQLAELLRHPVNLDIDVLEKDGQHYVLELNARFGGGYPFSHLAGVNLPLMLKNWLSGSDTSQESMGIKLGVVGFKAICPEVYPGEYFEV